ncbi:MAG TPA: hypothetical protein VN137_01515 [Sphingomonas sp.]|nr:hypothetical protein [Sphingomonas sp.]
MPELDPATARLIEDRYLPGTALRLRRVTAPDGSVVHKLGKKYPGAGLSSRPMTNIYLDAAEYAALAALPAALLVKRRYDVGGGFAIDVFEGALAGLMLAEISADDDAELAAIVAPSWCAAEVTEDVGYAGGTLAIDGWHATAAPRVVTIAEGDER